MGLAHSTPPALRRLLTLHECVEGPGGGQVGGDGDVLLVRALRLHPDAAVHVGAVAAHPARGVGDVGQAAVGVVPGRQAEG